MALFAATRCVHAHHDYQMVNALQRLALDESAVIGGLKVRKPAEALSDPAENQRETMFCTRVVSGSS